MLPADGILRAARRWLDLLARSTFSQAAALIKSDPRYADQTQTQYTNALEWLLSTGLLTREDGVLTPAPAPPGDSGQLIYKAALRTGAPPWLADSDTLVSDADSIPLDAAGLAASLGLSDTGALLAIRQVHGHMDLAERARVGAAGERALVNLLEHCWPGSTRHVALDHDGFGYDVDFAPATKTWHLEVKSTTRHGRLAVHLSRHELEVARLDPAWRLVVVGLDAEDQLSALASASAELFLTRSPQDLHTTAQWQSARYQLVVDDLTHGLPVLNGAERKIVELATRSVTTESFSWMPPA